MARFILVIMCCKGTLKVVTVHSQKDGYWLNLLEPFLVIIINGQHLLNGTNQAVENVSLVEEVSVKGPILSTHLPQHSTL